MILTIDCGNTNTVFALYSYKNLLKQEGCWRIYNNSKRTGDSYYSWICQMLELSKLKIDYITGVSIASVVPETLFNIISFVNKYLCIDPFIVGQKIAAPKIAIKYKIPLIIYGENPAEYGNNIDDNFNPKMDESYFSTEKSKLNNFYLAGYSKKELINRNILTEKDFNFYKPIDIEEVKGNNLEIHYMSYYKRWDPQENYYYAVDNCGFKPAEQRTVGSYSKYSSLDDKIDMFHYYTTCIKFGIGRATYDSSQEVRNGKINREEAISLVKRFDLEFPERFFSYFLEYTGLNKDEFFNTVDSFRPEHLWYKNGNEWHLKNPVWNNK